MNSDSSRHSNATTARLRAAISESKVGRFVAGISTAIDESAVARAGRRLADWVQKSYLFRWLTAAPEPDVIVIDLRETVLIGPLLAALDRVVAALSPAVEASDLLAATRSATATLARAPLRIAGLAGVVAFSGLVAATALTGTLTQSEMGAFAVLLGLALAATRVHLSWQELGETKVGKAVAAAFEPPEYDDG